MYESMYNQSNESSISRKYIPNNNNVEFFQLPKLSKSDSDIIFEEVATDMESIWTPSKLVETLDKHIISQKKAKKIIA